MFEREYASGSQLVAVLNDPFAYPSFTTISSSAVCENSLNYSLAFAKQQLVRITVGVSQPVLLVG